MFAFWSSLSTKIWHVSFLGTLKMENRKMEDQSYWMIVVSHGKNDKMFTEAQPLTVKTIGYTQCNPCNNRPDSIGLTINDILIMCIDTTWQWVLLCWNAGLPSSRMIKAGRSGMSQMSGNRRRLRPISMTTMSHHRSIVTMTTATATGDTT